MIFCLPTLWHSENLIWFYETCCKIKLSFSLHFVPWRAVNQGFQTHVHKHDHLSLFSCDSIVIGKYENMICAICWFLLPSCYYCIGYYYRNQNKYLKSALQGCISDQIIPGQSDLAPVSDDPNNCLPQYGQISWHWPPIGLAPSYVCILSLPVGFQLWNRLIALITKRRL